MKGLSISGGETKLSGLIGIAKSVIEERGFEPDIITGNSASSLAVVLIAMKKWKTLKEASTNLTLDTIFSSKPINKKRKLTIKAIYRAIVGKESISVMGNLELTIKKYIPKKLFEEYVKGDYAICFVNTTDFATGSRVVYNLKELEYDKFVQVIKASSSIPLLGETVKMDGGYHLDGGLRATILSPWLIDNYKNKIHTHVSIYSRPSNLKNILDKWKPSNGVATAGRATKIGLLTISKGDELVEDLLCDKYNIKQHKLFLPKLSDLAFNVNKVHLLTLYNKGIQVGRRLNL